MVAVLAVRGPVTAIGVLVGVATLSWGTFFTAARNTAIDCAKGSATGNACVVDIAESVISALVAVGTSAGAFYIGLVTPTPRDLTGASPIFRVDGVDVDWHAAMSHHRFGQNRTIDNPAVVEYQLNSTAPLLKYRTYSNADGSLVMRHETGLKMATGLLKRSTCDAYIDTILYGDNLRSSELAASISVASYTSAAQDLIDFYSDNSKVNGCVELAGYASGVADGYAAKFAFGAACAESIPIAYNCGTASYGDLLEFIAEG